MADPILASGIRVQAVFQGTSQLPEDRYVNTFAFVSDVASSEGAQLAAIAKVREFYTGTYAGGTVHQYMATNPVAEAQSQFRAYWMGEAPPRTPLVATWPPSSNLGNANAPFPSEVAVCLSYYAVSNQPRNRGRIYIGPLLSTTGPETVNQPTRVKPEFMATLLGAGIALAQDDTGPRWCVLAKNASSDTRELKLITNTFVDNAFDTQRRRGEAATSRIVAEVV